MLLFTGDVYISPNCANEPRGVPSRATCIPATVSVGVLLQLVSVLGEVIHPHSSLVVPRVQRSLVRKAPTVEAMLLASQLLGSWLIDVVVGCLKLNETLEVWEGRSG